MSDAERNETNAAASGFEGVERKTLGRLSIPGDRRELVLTEITYPPGGSAPLHRHPVDRLVYIVEGVAESAYGDDEPRRYEVGQTFQDRADAPHTIFRNCDRDRPLRFLATYVLEPGGSYVTES